MESIVNIAWNKVDWSVTIQNLAILSAYFLAFKTILGFHWPWEKCACPECGKKYRDHKKKEKE